MAPNVSSVQVVYCMGKSSEWKEELELRRRDPSTFIRPNLNLISPPPTRTNHPVSSSFIMQAAASDDAKNLNILIIRARWNSEVTEKLSQDCQKVLTEKLNVQNVKEITVPGVGELPFAAAKAKCKKEYDAVIVIGCQTRNYCSGKLETQSTTHKDENPNEEHFRITSQSVSNALMKVCLQEPCEIPVITGVLYVPSMEQVDQLTSSKVHHFGEQWARSAVEMARM